MNLPDNDNATDKFCSLAEDFNKSATTFANGGGLTLDGLMTKFNILWKFKAECPQHQIRLTQGMFDGGMQILRRIADPAFRESLDAHSNNVQQIFNFLTTPEQIQFLPNDASDRLVDAALDLVKKSEGVGYVYGWNDYNKHKDSLIALAKNLTSYAEKTREPKPQGAVFAVAKTIPPAKRLTVTQPDNGM